MGFIDILSYFTINPIITRNDWSDIINNIGDIVDIRMLDSSGMQLLLASNKQLGCTNEDYVEYSSHNDVDDGSCSTLIGDLNGDHIINILDVVQLVHMVLSNIYDGSADINQDGLVNVLDIVMLVNIILS